MGVVNFILQSKGGIGKSLVAVLLFQYLQERGVKVIGLDVDPLNATFGNFASLMIIKMNIMDGDDIDARLFDELVDSALQLSQGEHLVVDSGTSSFVKLFAYLKTNDAFGIIQEAGHTVRLHPVIAGSDMAKESFLRVRDFAVAFPAVQQVVWKNYFFGPVELLGKTFEETDLYVDFQELFYALVTIPNLDKDTFGKDISKMLTDQVSFIEAINSNKYHVMPRQRLKIFWDQVKTELDKVHLYD